jgi:hypothetical protein
MLLSESADTFFALRSAKICGRSITFSALFPDGFPWLSYGLVAISEELRFEALLPFEISSEGSARFLFLASTSISTSVSISTGFGVILPAEVTLSEVNSSLLKWEGGITKRLESLMLDFLLREN